MSIWGIFNKHGKIEQYEKKSEPMGGYYSISTSAGKEERVGGFEADQHLSPSKKERTVSKPVSALTHNNPITG